MASAGLSLSHPGRRLRARWSHLSLDERLAAGVDPASDPALATRAAQLCSPRHRRRLASWVERVAAAPESAGRRGVSSAVPIVPEQVAVAHDSLLALARELRETRQPVHPRGVAIARRLLTDSDSNLYTRTGRGAVEIQVQAARRALRVRGDRIAEMDQLLAAAEPSRKALEPRYARLEVRRHTPP